MMTNNATVYEMVEHSVVQTVEASASVKNLQSDAMARNDTENSIYMSRLHSYKIVEDKT